MVTIENDSEARVLRIAEKLRASGNRVATLAAAIRRAVADRWHTVIPVLFLALGLAVTFWVFAQTPTAPKKRQDRLPVAAPVVPPAPTAATKDELRVVLDELARLRREYDSTANMLAMSADDAKQIRAWIAAHDKRWPPKRR